MGCRTGITIKRQLLGIPLTFLLGCGGKHFTSAPQTSPEQEAGLDAQPDATPEKDAGPEAGPDAEPEPSLEAGPDAPSEAASPDASDDAQPDVLTEAGWDATDFDAFADGGQPCITGLDQPYCTNGPEPPWLVPMICWQDAWQPDWPGSRCNYGCTNGKCNCTAPMGRLLVNVVSGPPQQRYITDTVTGYTWFTQPSWVGLKAETEALCAALPGGYRLPTLEEVKTLMAETSDAPATGMFPPEFHCKWNNADPVLGDARNERCLSKDGESYGFYTLGLPTWVTGNLPSDTTYSVFCIKSP